jgi:hypothetical protein
MTQELLKSDQVAVPRPGVEYGCKTMAFLTPLPGCTGPADALAAPDDERIVARVVDAYNHAISNAEARDGSMWQYIFNNYQREIDAVLRARDLTALATILRDPGSTNLFYGFENLTLNNREAVEQTSVQTYFATLTLEQLLRVAETIGAVVPYCPEHVHGLKQKPTCWSAETVIERIEQALGCTLSFPNPFPDEHGVWTSRGVVSDRVPPALYQAWRIRQLVRGIESPRVLEIGAGLGRTAFYARQFGVQDYTIIDLPFTSISQGYFLARTLGEDQVSLAGETAAADEAGRIKIRPPHEFFSRAESYDLVLNVDSLTEMTKSDAQAYLTRIAASSKMFLSINHEYNPFAVRQLIDEIAGARVHRHLYALRAGYVEELVTF